MPLMSLSEVCSLITDGTHYTPPDVGAGMSFLTVKDIQKDGSLDFEGCSKISPDEYQKAVAGNSAPRLGDVLFSKDGTVGKVSVVRDDRQFAVLSSIAILRPNLGLIDSEYLGHVLRSEGVLDQALKKKTGSAIRRIILSDLKGVRFFVPTIPEQRRIAAILDKADALRAKRRDAIAKLDQLLQSVFLEMFGDPVNNDKGWPDNMVLGDVSETISGITKGRKTSESVRSVPYLTVANVQDKQIKLDLVKSIEATETEIQRYRLEKNDLLLTEGGDPDKLGRGALWDGSIMDCIHQNHVFRVRVISNQIDPVYLSWLVGSARGKRYFLGAAKQTTGIASINMSQLRRFPLLMPPMSLQLRFAELVGKINAEGLRIFGASSSTDRLFESLQQRAFTGAL